jgi:hypothetical protein
MQAIEKKELFSEVTAQDSATVSGGGRGDDNGSGTNLQFFLGDYIFYLGAGTLFGNPGLTPDEVQHGWQESIYSLGHGHHGHSIGL